MKPKHPLYKVMVAGFMFLLLSAPVKSWAFLYEVQVMTQEELKGLKDDQLVNAYIDAMIELDAATLFHKAAGFNPKEYDKYKKLLRYTVDLSLEIQKRQLELPDLQILKHRN